MNGRISRKASSKREPLPEIDHHHDDPGIELRKKGIYYITGEIEDESLVEIHQDIVLKHLDPKWKDDIQVIVNTVGGYCPETWGLVDLLDYVRMDVRTVGLGECCSAGAVLLASGTPGKRVRLHAIQGISRFQPSSDPLLSRRLRTGS